MNPESVEKESVKNVFTRRAFLDNAAKSTLLLALTGQILLSKKALAGAYSGQSLNLVLIQPHKISGEVLRKSFEEQTGAKLNVTIVPYDVIEAQATLDVQSGANQFDVVEYWYASIGSLVENNVLQDVTELITRDEATIKTSDFIRSIYDPYTLYRGKRWGLPYDGDTHVLFYNARLLEKHQVKVPTTWDEYLIAAKTITAAEKQNGVYGAIVMGAAIPVIMGSTFANRLAGFGGEFLKPMVLQTWRAMLHSKRPKPYSMSLLMPFPLRSRLRSNKLYLPFSMAKAPSSNAGPISVSTPKTSKSRRSLLSLLTPLSKPCPEN
jgi:multiple sugar transport system substrate-binding protein